jgi:hypothetical protein
MTRSKVHKVKPLSAQPLQDIKQASSLTIIYYRDRQSSS